jgi:TP901 family phage tail tape measure protein
MSSSKVRSGQVYVEIGADPSKFFGALKKINARIAGLGRDLSSIGARLGGAGVGLAAPFVASIAAGTKFQDTLLAIRASTGATAAELDAVRAAAMQMSQALGVGPTQATQGMLELLKAGMSLGDVLGGAGKSAIEFAKVGELDVATAAVVMSDAMNVFGVSAETAANTLSAAADSSSTSIAKMAESFSMVAAVAAQSNQSIGDVSAALAVLANNGIKGSDAGTSLKTMLLRLKAPVDEAEEALAQMGLSVMSFRNADGTMKPMIDIIRTIADATRGMDAAMRDDIFRRVFGQDAIRAAEVFSQVGVAGFESMQDAMGNAMPVSEKFQALMSGLSGAGIKISAAMERLAIAISDALAGGIQSTLPPILGLINAITNFATKNAALVATLSNVAFGAVAAGGALVGLGVVLQTVAFGLGGVLGAAKTVLAPVGLLVGLASSLATAAASAAVSLAGVAVGLGGKMISAATGAASVLGSMAAAMGSAVRASLAFGAAGVNALRTFGALAASAAAAAFPAFVTGFGRATAAGSGFFVAFARGVRGQIASISLLRNAIGGIGGFGSALASDLARLTGPARRAAAEFVAMGVAIGREAGTAVARFAVESTAGIRRYAASVATAVAATVTGAARMAAAWAATVARAVAATVAAAGTSLAVYVGEVVAAVGATVSGAAAIAGAWLAKTFPALTAFAVQAAASLGRYIAQTAAAAAATVANAARIAAAWVAGGMPGLAAFAGAAASAFGGYLAGAARVVAGSVASAAAVAAAWLAPAAPILAIGAAIAGAGALVYNFGGQIRSALAPVGDLVGQAASALGTGFNAAVADGAVVMGDLYGTATKTFGGIYEAITAGDLSGAMDILWAGLVAGWLRGVEAIMSYVDPWITALQNVFTDLGTNIAILWDQMWTTLATTQIGAAIIGVFDNIANTVMATFDWLVASVQKAWIRVQGFITGAKDTEERIKAIDNENEARAEQRAQSRPGIEGRQRAAREQGDQMKAEAAQRQGAMAAGAEQTKADRERENQRRADERRAATVAAESNLDQATRAGKENRVQREQAAELEQGIGSAQTMDELHDLAAQLHALNAAGRLTEEEFLRMQEQLGIQQEKIAEQEQAGAEAARKATEDGAQAAGNDAMKSKSEVAGTFSAVAAAGMGFGSTLQERIAKAAEETAKNTRDPKKPKVGE